MPTDIWIGDAADRHGATILSLRAELRDDARWVATDRPRLTWTVGSSRPDWIQEWAEVQCGADVVRLNGADSVLVPWPFTPLSAGEQRRVRVRAASTHGEVTPWSTELATDAAFVQQWIAQPIGLATPEYVARPALVRTSFSIDRPVRRALLHSTALGVAEHLLNGDPVDDDVLAPGWTSYQLRTVHDTTDVTALLEPGENVLSARVAGGWYTEEYHVLTRPKRFYGDQPSVVAQLEIEFEDGTRQTIATDRTWRAVPDPEILTSGIYRGESVDARSRIHGWDRPGFDASDWPAASVSDDVFPTPVPRMSPPVRRIETVAVRAVTRSASGGVILDFGQNVVGRLRIRVSGDAGTHLTFRHAEVLENGELALRPLRLAVATDEYTLRGDPVEEWEPRFTFHGFRFAQIDGWPGEFDPADVEAVVLHTDMRRTGWFESSDARLNRFHENVVWTMRGNYLAVPMDCPQRDERLGWTGDTQLFAPTAAFLFDCESFYLSWLRDLALEQKRAGGVVPLFAPDVIPDFADRGPIAAWGDAIAIVPEALAQATGDDALLDEIYPAMRSWVDVCIDALDPDGLWTAGRQLGDWLDPNAPPNAPARGRTDTDITSTAYFVRTTRLVGDIARRLGHHDDAHRFADAAERTREAFMATYVTPGGRMVCDTQTAYAIAIVFDIVPEGIQRDQLAQRLADVVRRDGFHIATGLIGTSMIAQALTMGGHVDVVERLLFQTESPSWLFPVSVGATTVWERWDGLRPDGSLNPGAMVSFNHVALGSVAAWLHERVAGLAAATPGYRMLRIEPLPLRRLDRASARHETPYGLAEAGWERTPDGIRVTAIVPTNTRADVHLPDGQTLQVGSGTHEWTVAETPVEAPAPLTLDSSMASLADDEAAYAAFHSALAASPNAFVARAVRANAIYRDTLRIRDALIFADAPTLDAVASALAGAGAAPITTTN